MKLCIYFKKTEPDVIFLSEEHIFPAGIGGIQKLPQEYVSHECNNAFSRMEMFFMRNSLISIPRQFYGPGKRGKLSPKNATKSNVSLMSKLDNPTALEFGYISLGKPYSISQIHINTNGTCHFISDRSFGDAEKQVTNFNKNLFDFNHKYIIHEDTDINKDIFILGFHEGNWYLGLSDKNHISQIDFFIKKLLEQKSLENKTPTYGCFIPKVHQTLEFSDDYFKTCAKIIFNYLAFIKGQDFALKECFDPLRNWIVHGGKNHFAQLLDRQNEREMFDSLTLPKNAHRLMIIQIDNNLVAYISFYGSNFETVLNIGYNIEESFETNGFICDWENRREYTLNDFLLELHKKNEDHSV